MGPAGRPTRLRRGIDGRETIAIAVALAALIFWIRELLPNPNEGVTNLYAIPIVLVAVRFGARAGAMAAAISLGLFLVWELRTGDIEVGPVGYISRGTAFLLVGVIVGRFATERRVLVGRLHDLAHRDALTGLPNRAAFDERFAIELARMRRHGGSAALLLADLDGFKAINDTLGHRAGDRVLKQVAAVLRAHVRDTDAVARIGGDEFVALLAETDAAGADVVCDRLAVAITGACRSLAGDDLPVGASLGCVVFDGTTTASPEELLDRADQAMYEDKGRAAA